MDLEKTVASLERVISLGEELLTTFDINALLSNIVLNVQEIISVEGATLYLVDPIEKLMISHVIFSDRVEEIILNVDNTSIAGFTALNRQSLIIPDAYADLSKLFPALTFNKSVDSSSKFKTRDIITHPLIIKDELIGVFQLVNKKKGTFDNDDLTLLKNFSLLAGIAIMNARLLERVLEEQGNAYDIVEHICEEVFYQDREGMLIHINRQAAERLPQGMTFDQVKGKPLLEIFPHLSGLKNEIRKVIENNIDKAFSGGKMPYVIVTAKNAREVVEKVIIIIKPLPDNIE
ncbi:MAG: GAF domain-containing protein [Candidatus Riflebacteria bacterium]|nr:GAF domain-containing protein [Candidatus Riflebacteria bacterium]